MTVTAQGASLSSAAELDLEIVSLTVEGRTTMGYDIPVAGLAVSSQGESATSDADGRFTLSGLSVPYDLTTWDAVAERVNVYAGLTTPTPKVSELALALPATDRSATLQGNLTGDLLPIEPDEGVMVCFEGLDQTFTKCTEVGPAATTYSLTANWPGATTRDVRLHVLKVQYDGLSRPANYPAYAVEEFTMTDGVVTDLDLEGGEPLGTQTLLVEIESSADITQTMVGVQFGDSLFMPLLRDSSGAKVLAAVMPEIPNHTYSVVSMGTLLNFAWASEITGDSVNVLLPDAPTLTSPTTGATGVTTATVFEVDGWTGPLVHLWQPNTPGAPTISLASMASSVTIPDTSELGFALPASADYSWTVVGRSGTSVEAVTNIGQDMMTLFSILFGGSNGPTGTGALTMTTGIVNFTTAP